MKKITFLSLVAVLLFLGACKDKNEDPAITNSFSFDGKTSALDKGFRQYYGEHSELNSWDHDLFFFSPDVKMSTETCETSGIGALVYIDLNSSAEEFGSGEFSWSTEVDESGDLVRNPNSIVYMTISTDYNFNTNEGQEYKLTSGTATVTQSGSTYTIAFNGATDNGKSITGSYSGTIKEVTCL